MAVDQPIEHAVLHGAGCATGPATQKAEGLQVDRGHGLDVIEAGLNTHNEQDVPREKISRPPVVERPPTGGKRSTCGENEVCLMGLPAVRMVPAAVKRTASRRRGDRRIQGAGECCGL